MPNETAPYEIGPNDLTEPMLRRNLPPTGDQIIAMLERKEAFDIHDPSKFRQDIVASRMELNDVALKETGRLAAPRLIYHQSVMDMFDRMNAYVELVRPGSSDKNLMLDCPAAFTADPDMTKRTAACSSSSKICIESCSVISTAIIMARIKHGIEPHMTSLVGHMPDAKPDPQKEGDNVMSLVNVHSIDDDTGGGFLFFTIFVP